MVTAARRLARWQRRLPARVKFGDVAIAPASDSDVRSLCYKAGYMRSVLYRDTRTQLPSRLIIVCLALVGCGGSPAVTAPPPGTVITPIPDVQGRGDASPLDGQSVTVTGIVTGDFQDGDADTGRNLGGFFMQEETPDADPASSDGVFVYDGRTPSVDIKVGDRVNIAGTVTERFGETQITASTVTVTGSGSVQATDIILPAAATMLNSDGLPVADLERYEGMLVRVRQSLVVNDLFNLGRFGEISVSEGGRLQQFTNGNPPGIAAWANHRRLVAARSLIVDDGSSLQNVMPIRFLNPAASDAADYSLRSGDSLTGLQGNIRYSRGSGGAGFEAYRVEPTVDPLFASQNVRPAAPPDPGGTIKVAGFNVLNFFTTIDGGLRICGPLGNAGCRGADSIEEFARQRVKLLHTLALLDADIVGLTELENNGGASISDLVDGLNTIAGAGTWSFVNTGTIGEDVIAVGLIYKTAAVRKAGNFATLTAAFDARFNDRRNRPTLAQTFAAVANNGRFTVVVNHLKSKGSPCSDIGDPNLDDGQGNCNATRTNAVLAMIDWLATDPTLSLDPDFLIIGDLNAYLAEDPVMAFEKAGYTVLVDGMAGQAPYTFVFAGQAGVLDHAIASPAFAGQVSGVAIWHINSDEPPVLDYNLEFGRDAGLYDATIPFRVSDHDPLIIGVDP